ncbi:MAG: rod shape-determining protein MreC, partial [Ilumatobacteraceae bacterium]
MAVYSVGRRRVILLLLLTSVLLLTIDLRGNAVFDRARILFDGVLSPLESAARVVTNPVRDGWRAINEYDDLIEENQRLQRRIDEQLGAEITARNVIVENQQLLALNNLESIANLPTVTAQVIGPAPSNLDQVIEIDVGSDLGVATGMAVVNEAGLVGKVHEVFPSSSFVMLVTDPRYAVPVKVLSEEGSTPTTTVPVTVPSGIPI